MCKYALIIEDFPYPLCKIQSGCPPVWCPNDYLQCEVYKEYNIDTSAQHLNKKLHGGEIV